MSSTPVFPLVNVHGGHFPYAWLVAMRSTRDLPSVPLGVKRKIVHEEPNCVTARPRPANGSIDYGFQDNISLNRILYSLDLNEAWNLGHIEGLH
jgi:hypothetical protein